MKKLFSIAAMTALLATAANADVMRIEGAVGAWQTDPTGTIQYGSNSADQFDVVDNAGLDSSTNTYVWVYLKHPIPILPNIRFEYVDPSFSGTSSSDIKVGNTTYTAGASNTLSLTQYDTVLYYNILDNTFWTTIDLGLDVKFIDGNYNVSATAIPTYDEDFSLAMPLAYVRARLQFPVTNIGAEVIARGMSYSGNTVVDTEIKLDYTMDFVPVVQPGIEVGYRYQQVKLDGGSIGIDANIDMTFSGVYGGIMVRF